MSKAFLGQMLALTSLMATANVYGERGAADPARNYAPVSNPEEIAAAREAEAQRRREKHAAKMARREAQRNQHKK